MRIFVMLFSLLIGVAFAQPHGNPSPTSGTAAITGGTINGATIGATTPASGTFTTLRFTTSLTADSPGLIIPSGDSLDIRRGTNAQSMYLYNTYTSATSYERARLQWSNNVLFIGTQVGSGGGTDRGIRISSSGGGIFAINESNLAAVSWAVQSSNHFLPGSTNSFDLGSSSQTVRTGYFGTSVVVGGATLLPTLSGTSASLGGGALLAGDCASNTTTVTGAASGMTVVATPGTYPGDGNYWLAYVSASNTVTTKVCAVIAGTPTASTYNIRVIQ